MLSQVWSFVLSLYTLMLQVTVPCTYPEQLFVKSIDRQQFLGKWYFKAAVSFREADIQKFKAFDNIYFNIEEKANDTVILTGHMRMADDCIKQTWTYHIQPERDDMVLEGRPQRRNLLWSGSWANCHDCIIFQEIEPPLSETDSTDSLGRFFLYARQSSGDSEMLSTFLKNAVCNGLTKSVILPQEKEFCV